MGAHCSIPAVSLLSERISRGLVLKLDVGGRQGLLAKSVSLQQHLATVANRQLPAFRGKPVIHELHVPRVPKVETPVNLVVLDWRSTSGGIPVVAAGAGKPFSRPLQATASSGFPRPSRSRQWRTSEPDGSGPSMCSP